MNLFVSGQFVKAEIAKLIEQFPELKDDDDLRADAIEGETDAHALILDALQARQDAQTMVGAIKARQDDLQARRGRFERKAEAMSSLIKNVMRAANLANLQLPEATITITAGKASVGIMDLGAIPQGYFKLEKVVDKQAIRSAIDAGEDIPGAGLVIGETSVSIRTR